MNQNVFDVMNQAANEMNRIQGEDMLEKFENLKEKHMEQKEMNEEISDFFNDFTNEEDVDDELKELEKELLEEDAQQVQPGQKQKVQPQTQGGQKVVVKA